MSEAGSCGLLRSDGRGVAASRTIRRARSARRLAHATSLTPTGSAGVTGQDTKSASPTRTARRARRTSQIQLDLAAAESTIATWEQQHRSVRSLTAGDVAAALDHA